jgi:hypothetical protein
LNGELFFGGRRLPVEPFIGHDPARDLVVACRAAQDVAKSRGNAVDLCYAPDAMGGSPRTLRIERHPRLFGRVAMDRLRAEQGSAHFMIEPNGSLYQVLDLGHAARRAGEARPGEIRVLSANREAEGSLLAELRAHFPGLSVEDVEVSLDGPTAGQTPDAAGSTPKEAVP